MTYTFILLFIIEGSQDKNQNRLGTRRQELMFTGLLPMAFSVYELIETITIHNWLSHLPSIPNVENGLQLYLMEEFSQLRVSLLR